MRSKILIFFVAFLPVVLQAQEKSSSDLFNRLQAFSSDGIDYYNIDEVVISYQETNTPFSKENICNGLLVKESMLKKSATWITEPNFVFETIDTLCDNILQYSMNYLIQDKRGNIVHIAYMSVNKHSSELERTLTPLLLEKKIPETLFHKKFFNKFNFAGREVELGTYACRWTRINCVQCHYHGEMNWSMHKDSLDAVNSVNSQYYITTHCRKQLEMDVVLDKQEEVIFEGMPIKARKIVLQFKGNVLNMLKSSNVESIEALTVYYVVAPIRGNYISCVMSYWNNDLIEESGLPSLLEKVMQLKQE